MGTLSTLESTTLKETIRYTSKWFILTNKMQNLKLVYLKCVTNAQPIPLSLSWCAWANPTKFYKIQGV